MNRQRAVLSIIIFLLVFPSTLITSAYETETDTAFPMTTIVSHEKTDVVSKKGKGNEFFDITIESGYYKGMFGFYVNITILKNNEMMRPYCIILRHIHLWKFVDKKIELINGSFGVFSNTIPIFDTYSHFFGYPHNFSCIFDYYFFKIDVSICYYHVSRSGIGIYRNRNEQFYFFPYRR